MCISLCSCSSLESFGHTKQLLFKEIKIDNYITSNKNNYHSFEIIADGNSCFDNGIRNDVITVRADDLKQALSYFYKNKATWTIRKVYNNDKKAVEMIAYDEMKIKYEVVYCYVNYGGLFTDTKHMYASFKLVE
jgi:hypothetical protein